ncbi:response regulator [Pseudidiomarina sp. 1APR75-33.1]|uniref:response regulator n=1 Tax=Pseudidiomarina terrestris TaxID=2820060 RepID=UPI00265560EE|nr:response regulator [Pseudidiomarina sp. 1APR75-33.1]MDN7128188.1 response regulator [Pseudidiomarina sp. 1APR75-33.1]
MQLTSSQIILVVEDSDDDYEMLEEALKDGDSTALKNPIHRCEDGKSAQDFLSMHCDKSSRPEDVSIGLILLDLNLPGISGHRVLEFIKTNKLLKKIPVIVLTTSNDDRDIDECYDLGANTYIQKPVDLEKFLLSIQRLKEYWFNIAILPKER